MSDVPRSPQQLNQLRNEVRGGSVTLPAEQLQLLDWLLEPTTSSYYGSGTSNVRLRTLFNLLPNSPLITWAENETSAAAALGGITPGGMVRFASDPVRLLPVFVNHSADSNLELRFLWPDGRQKRLDEVAYVRAPASWSSMPQPSFVISEGALWMLAE